MLMANLEQYIRVVDSAKNELTEEAIELIRYRFEKLVHFWLVDNQELMEPGIARIKVAELETLYAEHRNLITRFAHIGRLPNVLIFGADVVGPDISNLFSKFIISAIDRELFLIKAKRNNRMYSERYAGRNIHPYEKRVIEEYGLTIDDVINAYPPNDISNMTKLINSGEGNMVIFYDPAKMPQKLRQTRYAFNSTLYPLPPIEAVDSVLVAWYRPFGIR